MMSCLCELVRQILMKFSVREPLGCVSSIPGKMASKVCLYVTVCYQNLSLWCIDRIDKGSLGDPT